MSLVVVVAACIAGSSCSHLPTPPPTAPVAELPAASSGLRVATMVPGAQSAAVERALDARIVEVLTETRFGAEAMTHAEDPLELLRGLLERRWEIAVGVLWPEGEPLPEGLIGVSYDHSGLSRLCMRGKDAAAPWLPRELAHWGEASIELRPHRRARVSGERLARAVHAGEAFCTLLPERTARRWVRYAPDRLQATKTGRGASRLVVYRSDTAGLGARIAATLAAPRLRAELRSVRVAHMPHPEGLETAHYVVFHRMLERRLPRYESLFRAAASANGLDWRILAALAYQESHWDPSARSPTGVRGLMMLTRRTAAEVGVGDRLDPKQSVEGAARYLRQLLESFRVTSDEQEALWLALAAYNMGAAGLAEVQARARALGLEGGRWAELQPLLLSSDDPKWREAGTYVQRVRDYLDILRSTRGGLQLASR
jgi:soluble lytic murein transglycosylase-like protein